MGKFTLIFCLFLLCELSSGAAKQADWPFPKGIDTDDVIDRIGQPPRSRDIDLQSRFTEVTNFNSGTATTTFVGNDELPRAVVIQSDGRAIVIGHCFGGASSYDICLARFHRNGTLDTSFGSMGKVVTTFGNLDDRCLGASLQTNGQVVIAGRTSNGTNLDFLLMRYNTNGTLDTSFKTVGALRTSIGTDLDIARSVEIDTLGRPVLAGYYATATQIDSAVVRYLTDGNLDTAFYTTGIRTLSFSEGLSSLTGIAIGTNGAISLTGGAYPGNWDVGLARLVSNGDFDTAFGTTGRVTASFGTGSDFVYAIRYNSLGKLVGIGGTQQAGSVISSVVVRFQTNGTLDTTFNSVGHHIRADGVTRAIVLNANGQVTAVGSAVPSADDTTRDFLQLRYRTNGTLDTFWNTTGVTITSIGTSADEINAISQWGAREFFVAGSTSEAGGIHVALTRIGVDGAVAPSGTIDRSYGVNGVPAGSLSAVVNLAFDANGRLLASGGAISGWVSIERYFSNGSSDAVFPVENGSFNNIFVTSDSLNRPVFYYRWGNVSEQVYRYNTNGSLDATFAGSGSLATSLDTLTTMPYAASTGAVFAFGRASALPTIRRYMSNGSLDTSFGTTGSVSHSSAGAPYVYGQFRAMSLDTFGRSVAVGYGTGGVEAVSQPFFLLTRYQTNGTLDTSFHTTGYRYLELGIGGHYLNGMALQTDGSIVGVGYTSQEGIEQFIAFRVTSNGVVDTAFNGQGWLAVDIGKPIRGNRFVQDPMTGDFWAGVSNYSTQGYLIRFSSSGFLNTSFGTNGLKPTTGQGITEVVLDSSGNFFGSCPAGCTHWRFLP